MTFIKQSLYILACLLCCLASAQQISIDNTFTAQELIENNLVQLTEDTSVERFRRPPTPTGRYLDEDVEFGLQRGIIELIDHNRKSKENEVRPTLEAPMKRFLRPRPTGRYLDPTVE